MSSSASSTSAPQSPPKITPFHSAILRHTNTMMYHLDTKYLSGRVPLRDEEKDALKAFRESIDILRRDAEFAQILAEMFCDIAKTIPPRIQPRRFEGTHWVLDGVMVFKVTNCSEYHSSDISYSIGGTEYRLKEQYASPPYQDFYGAVAINEDAAKLLREAMLPRVMASDPGDISKHDLPMDWRDLDMICAYVATSGRRLIVYVKHKREALLFRCENKVTSPDVDGSEIVLIQLGASFHRLEKKNRW